MKSLFTSRIGRKITGGYLVLSAIILATVLFSLFQLSRIETIISDQLMDRANARSLTKDIIIRAGQVSSLVDDYCAAAGPSKKEAIRINIMDTVTVLRVFIHQLSERKLDREESELVFRLVNLHGKYIDSLNRVIERSVRLDEFDHCNSRITTLMLQIDRKETELMYGSWLFSRDRIMTIRIILIAFCFVATAAGIALSVLRTRSIVDPIKKLVAVLDGYGRGNVNVRAEVSGDDEIAYFSKRFNAMLTQINEFSEGLQRSNERLQDNIVKLDESNSRLQALSDAIPYSVLVIDPSGVLIEANLTFTDMFQYGTAEIAGMTVFDLSPDTAHAEELARAVVETLASGKSDRESLAKKKDGALLPIMARIRPLRYGGATYLLFAMADITERKTSEEKIRQQYVEIQEQYSRLELANRELEQAHGEIVGASLTISEEKERLSTTLRSIAEGVITTDVEGRIEIMNRAAEVITGTAFDSARGRPITEVFLMVNEKSGEPYEDPIGLIMKRHGFVEFQERTVLISADGARKIISPVIAPILKSDSTIFGVVIAFRDVTERVRMEDEIQKASKIESLGIFAGGIAHDFNNYLTAILGGISLVKAGLSDTDPSAEVLSEAEHITMIAKNLTNQLLTFSRGGVPIITTVAVESLLRDSVNFVLSGSPVKAEFNVAPDLWSAMADEGQLGQVVHNLVINARQAMPAGGDIFLEAKNLVVGENAGLPLVPGNYIRISIVDNGPGIPEDLLQKIFDPYFTTKSEGNGLGLTITYSIIKKHQGHIEVRSEPGHGTAFVLYIPASTSPVETKSAGTSRRDFHGMRVLVMDDEQFILNTATRMLERMGFSVTTARSGNDAVRLYREAMGSNAAFDVVIMDLTIPGGMGGKEAIGLLKEIDRQIRAVVSSGYSNDPVMASFRDYGFSGVVVKPYRFSDLEDVLSSVLPENR